ncbi:other/FunK1 protein kinase [Coprinopsis cinerea okayama7|uniref:Other/FunK1 protein kinase n=1 Tax=Coprinopsis cinerea (strain Okayama-7 / 130 / ATCC MYA-4618 / FGSC 9003) TaxID=240176 RepID=A8NB83_COPC7|nr:other/FunK1 protein kinase [Coprinopsis cinerea okayama7\|eukprot:XP_001832082.1 other/FunK1 protein kinase [Coprinopsis cinerea okayama7\
MGYELITCHAEEFIQSHLPKDGLSNFDAIMAELREQKVLEIRPLTQPKTAAPRSTHTFKAFKGLFRPGHVKPTRVLKALQATWNSVRKAMGRIAEANSNDHSFRSVDGEGAAIDTCLTANMDTPLRSTDVVIPFRVTTGIGDNDQNIPDPLPDFLSVINEDARRSHLYAITIEDSHMSLWYLSRSLCTKSTPFSILENTNLVVQTFISLMAATDEELGYDPLVTLLPDFTYVYELPPDEGRKGSLYYQTVGLVSEFHSDDPVGRSARVWKVKQVASPTDLKRVPGTSDRILKDVSLDARMKPEVDTQRQLFADIAAFGKRVGWRSADVLKDMREEDMDTLADALNGENFKRYFSCIIASHVGKGYSSQAYAQGPPESCSDDPRPTFVPKRRCFYLYEFICTPLYDIRTLGEAIDILKQCLTAMRLMYCAGWIHRDISVGNILAIRSGPEAPWEMKLSDLEFARKFQDPEIPKGEEPIGTPFFMACELQTGMPFTPGDDPSAETDHDSEPELSPEDFEPFPPILHNPQHDLESIWWIVLWLVTARTRASSSRKWSDIFFKNSKAPVYGRTRAMLLSSLEPLDFGPVFPKDLPSGLYAKPLSFIRCLDVTRLDIWRSYKLRFKAKAQEDPGSYSWMMGKGASKFFRAVERSRQAWASIPLIVVTEREDNRKVVGEPVQVPSSPKKRKAEDEVVVPTDASNRLVPTPANHEHEEKPQRPRKRLRVAAVDSTAQAERSRPVTRSMTREQRNAGPTTRSMTRRLQQPASTRSRQTRSSVTRTHR